MQVCVARVVKRCDVIRPLCSGCPGSAALGNAVEVQKGPKHVSTCPARTTSRQEDAVGDA